MASLSDLFEDGLKDIYYAEKLDPQSLSRDDKEGSVRRLGNSL